MAKYNKRKERKATALKKNQNQIPGDAIYDRIKKDAENEELLNLISTADVKKASPPVITAILGGILSLCCMAWMIFSFYKLYMDDVADDELIFVFLSVVPVIFSIWMFISYFSNKIWYTDSFILVRNVFLQKKVYSYSQITGINRSDYDYRLYFGKCSVELSNISESQMEFLDFAYVKYRQIYKKGVPEKKRYRVDFYKGNIKNGMGFAFAFSLIIILLGWVCVDGYFYIDEDLNYETERVIFTDYEFEESILGDRYIYLSSDDNDYYKVEYVPQDFKFEKLENICDRKKEVAVQVVNIGTDRKGVNELSVRSITNGKEEILSLKETELLYRQSRRVMFHCALGLLLTVLLFFAVTIVVGRNVNKYPTLAKLIFNEDNITWRSHL